VTWSWRIHDGALTPLPLRVRGNRQQCAFCSPLNTVLSVTLWLSWPWMTSHHQCILNVPMLWHSDALFRTWTTILALCWCKCRSQYCLWNCTPLLLFDLVAYGKQFASVNMFVMPQYSMLELKQVAEQTRQSAVAPGQEWSYFCLCCARRSCSYKKTNGWETD